jgi:hydroxymethylbilane synthase
MPPSRCIRIGTRGSKLARWQSDWVAGELRARGATVEIVEIATQGDVQQQGAVASLGIQGLFTKEIQAAVLNGRVDLAVHSLKDLPTQQVTGLVYAATPAREDPADALVSNIARSLEELPIAARVGTGSLRRRAQLLNLRPDLQIIGIRGNVDTRLKKLDEGEYDAIVLAAAGLLRLGWGDRIAALLKPPQMLPAPGQGALALECREDDQEVLDLAWQLDDRATRLSTVAERAVLGALHGGCSAPIAAWGRLEGEELVVDARVISLDGRTIHYAQGSATVLADERAAMLLADEVGRRVADRLLQEGAGAVIDSARRMN